MPLENTGGVCWYNLKTTLVCHFEKCNTIICTWDGSSNFWKANSFVDLLTKLYNYFSSMKLIANSLLYIYLNAFKCNFVSFWVGNNLAYIAICSAPNSALHIYQLIEINFSDKTSQTQMQRWSPPFEIWDKDTCSSSTFKNSYVNNYQQHKRRKYAIQVHIYNA